MAEKPSTATDVVAAPDTSVGEVDEVPYSIYSRKEKWLIVGMVALAGFYRYTYTFPSYKIED
jgi:hypothetical protein